MNELKGVKHRHISMKAEEAGPIEGQASWSLFKGNKHIGRVADFFKGGEGSGDSSSHSPSGRSFWCPHSKLHWCRHKKQ